MHRFSHGIHQIDTGFHSFSTISGRKMRKIEAVTPGPGPRRELHFVRSSKYTFSLSTQPGIPAVQTAVSTLSSGSSRMSENGSDNF